MRFSLFVTGLTGQCLQSSSQTPGAPSPPIHSIQYGPRPLIHVYRQAQPGCLMYHRGKPVRRIIRLRARNRIHPAKIVSL